MGDSSAERKSATAAKMKRRNIFMKENEKLTVIDGETLMDMKLPPTKFCVETLLPQGISILGGAPKIDKSWLVLDLCVRIAKGEAIWNLSTQKGTTLCLCLEDPLNRIQQRLCMLTDEYLRTHILQPWQERLQTDCANKYAILFRSILTRCLLLLILFKLSVQAPPTHLTQTIMMM